MWGGFGEERRRAPTLFPEKLWGARMGSPAISFAKYPFVLQHQRAVEWLVMRAQFGLALNTIDAYARALSSYFAFSEKENITPELSGRAEVARWINEERERGIANATLILRLTALRLFFDYLVEENERPNNPVFRGGATRTYGSAVFRSPGPIRRLRKLPWIPTDEEWQRILDVTAADSLRDRTMLALAYDGALRREELCSAEVPDLDFSRRLLTIRAETTKNKVWKNCAIFARDLFVALPIPESPTLDARGNANSHRQRRPEVRSRRIAANDSLPACVSTSVTPIATRSLIYGEARGSI
jgi:integrase